MALDRQQRAGLSENLILWSERWALSFAFAVTQSIEESEKVVAETVVALLDDAYGSETSSKRAELLARMLWHLSKERAYKGFGSDSFFRLPVLTRAIVVLKTKAEFSTKVIAQVFDLEEVEVQDQLENARLLFSEGKTWIAVNQKDLKKAAAAACEEWDLESHQMQGVFARYVGNDLDTESGKKMYSHLIVCSPCRERFSGFKTRYSHWVMSVPQVELDQGFRKNLKQISHKAMKLKNHPRKYTPNPMHGFIKLAQDPQFRASLLGAASVLLLFLLFAKR